MAQGSNYVGSTDTFPDRANMEQLSENRRLSLTVTVSSMIFVHSLYDILAPALFCIGISSSQQLSDIKALMRYSGAFGHLIGSLD